MLVTVSLQKLTSISWNWRKVRKKYHFVQLSYSGNQNEE